MQPCSIKHHQDTASDGSTLGVANRGRHLQIPLAVARKRIREKPLPRLGATSKVQAGKTQCGFGGGTGDVSVGEKVDGLNIRQHLGKICCGGTQRSLPSQGGAHIILIGDTLNRGLQQGKLLIDAHGHGVCLQGSLTVVTTGLCRNRQQKIQQCCRSHAGKHHHDSLGNGNGRQPFMPWAGG